MAASEERISPDQALEILRRTIKAHDEPVFFATSASLLNRGFATKETEDMPADVIAQFSMTLKLQILTKTTSLGETPLIEPEPTFLSRENRKAYDQVQASLNTAVEAARGILSTLLGEEAGKILLMARTHGRAHPKLTQEAADTILVTLDLLRDAYFALTTPTAEIFGKEFGNRAYGGSSDALGSMSTEDLGPVELYTRRLRTIALRLNAEKN